jgi:hypothetical protein
MPIYERPTKSLMGDWVKEEKLFAGTDLQKVRRRELVCRALEVDPIRRTTGAGFLVGSVAVPIF